jgi:hypothetical protein
MRKIYEKYWNTFPELLRFELQYSDYLQHIKPLEAEGRKEKSICFAIWKSQSTLRAHIGDDNFWDVFKEEVCKWSWGRDDPRWETKRRQQEELERAKAAQIEADKQTIIDAGAIKGGCVYFIQGESGGAIKVGFSTELAKRLSQLQTGFPDTLRLLLAIPGTQDREKAIHKRLSKYWLRGEWYKDTPEVREAMRKYGERYASKCN